MRPTNGAITHGTVIRKQSRVHRGRLIVLLALAALATFVAVAPFGGQSYVHAQTSGGNRKIIFVGGIAGGSDCNKPQETYIKDWNDLRKAASDALSGENIVLGDSDVIGFSYSGDDCAGTTSGFVVPSYSPQDTCFGVDHAVNWLNLEILRLLRENPDTKFDLIAHSMGGVVISRWIALSNADSDEIRAIHSATTIDSPLQGVDGLGSNLARAYYLKKGCVINDSLTDMSLPSSVIESIKSPEKTTLKVPFVTIHNIKDLAVPPAIATIPGVWKDVTVTCDDTGAILDGHYANHECALHDPVSLSAVAYAVSHDVTDERPASQLSQQPSGHWSSVGGNDSFLGTKAIQSNQPGDSVSAQFVGPTLVVSYAEPSLSGNITAQLPVAEVNVDSGQRLQELAGGSDCSTGVEMHGLCRSELDGLGDGSHTVTLTIKSAGATGGFIFDFFEAETVHSNAPLACPPVANVDVVLIIDNSGSMDQNDQHGQRLEASEEFVTRAENGDAIGVVTFNGDATTIQPLTTMGSDRNGIINAIKGITNNDGTDIGTGLQRAYDLLSADSSANKKAAILLTDGRDNPGSYGGQDQLFAKAGWPVYVIGLGTDIDRDFLNKVASGTGTKQFTPLSSPSQLISVYFDIARQQKCGVDRLNETHRLAQGETQKTTVTIPAGQLSASFLASWPGSVVDLSLIDPSGRLIDASATDASISHAKGLTYELYRVENPVTGDWIVQVFGRDILAGGEDVTVQAASIPQPSTSTPAPPVVVPSPASSGGFDYVFAAAATAIVATAIVLGGGFWVYSSASGPSGTLAVSAPGMSTSTFPLKRRSRPVSIGRSRSNDIVIDDPFISRNHARISKVGDAFVVEDLASTAGVTVNGAAVSMSPLRDGDVIGLGDSKLVFRLGRGT